MYIPTVIIVTIVILYVKDPICTLAKMSAFGSMNMVAKATCALPTTKKGSAVGIANGWILVMTRMVLPPLLIAV